MGLIQKLKNKKKNISELDLGPSVSQVTDVLNGVDYSEQVSGGIISPMDGRIHLSEEKKIVKDLKKQQKVQIKLDL